ncbi:uncharacterized protein BDZ99DRAFT_488863 [Mytilinidion resinicola]|uniref:Geranylgeranyl pyrophosphate synthetase n=1 Tax=Mytilinidion resinicola TaxID=574789 RepID=A0A6A6YMD5_9PEZI|nr:uncharacterized protein BDZ99DRAFT_488863 [Mytilinidion resinicola]KAF2809135.1 hypothetical protein BDZ99DRAFT_488863 [Mytilinidion resinicola]
MANDLIAEISRLGLEDLNTPASASITDVQHLSSYNWVEAPKATPTIAVPGSPDLWSPPNRPFRLEKDTGHIYIAQNAARHPDSPLEPLFRALYVSHPSFDITSIDVVTDRNNIRKLLAFVNPRWNSYKREAFTIHVEVTNNTAILCREETKTDEYIGPNEFRGYGHSFEKNCTSRKVSGSTGHHRIISYRFGGLTFMIRHETDGYVGVAGTQLSPQPPANQAPELDDLSSILGSLSLSPESSTPGKSSLVGPKLVTRKEGQVVSLPSTLEIKTRVAHRPLAFEDVVSQLWVSQTPKLVRAYHNRGVFAVPKVEDVAVQVKTWEDQNQKDLRMLAGLIGKIREMVKESGGRATLRYNAIGDKLGFYKLGGKQMLPEGFKWEEHKDGGNEREYSC